MTGYQGIWRDPAEDTSDYPGLHVWDAQQSGSISIDQTRLPLWAFIWPAIVEGWDRAVAGWELDENGYHREQLAGFLLDLLEQRGEFGRLLCILADGERRERVDGSGRTWWPEDDVQRGRVINQLWRCLEALGAA